MLDLLLIMKNQIIFAVLCTSAQIYTINAQYNTSSQYNLTWTWMAGSALLQPFPVYGTPYSPNFDAGSRDGACAGSSVNGYDIFYVYGGSYLGSTYYGDFWAFDVQSAWWSTIHGGNGMAFGVKGQPSASVFPGIKYASSCILNGIDNRFYLFAGRTAMTMENHLWAYDFLLSQWAWLGGNNTVRTAYSVGRGIESPLNVPAARGTYFSAQTLNALTTVNALLMFGGVGYNDLWKFNVSSSQWSWLTGAIGSTYLAPVYGVQGVGNAANTPGGTSGHAAAVQYGTDKLFLFGGSSNNQLWVYDYWAVEWTFISSGPSGGSYVQNYQYPGGRTGHVFQSLPRTSLFVMTSGYGNGYIGYSGGLSDIWIYNVTANSWAWIGGEENSTRTGRFGMMGVQDSTSLPNRRGIPVSGVVASTGEMILYAGQWTNGSSYIHLNDLWYFKVNYPPNVTIQVTTTSSLATTHSTTAATSIRSSLATTYSTTAATSIRIVTRGPQQTSESDKRPTLSDEIMPFVGYIVLFILPIILFIVLFLVWRCYRNRQRQNNFKEFTSYSTQFTATHYSTNSLASNDGTTMLVSQTEFAVPGYLKYKAGAEFRWHTRIAKGGGGEVFLGDALIPKLGEFGPSIIVKVVAPNRESMTEKMADGFDQELSVMHYMGRHLNIAGMLGWCDEPMAILMKFYSNGSLEKFIKNNGAYSRQIKLSFSLDISYGLEFMHSKQVAHCDMKPANILIDQDQYGNMFCALTDFGISQMYSLNSQLVRAFKVANLQGASLMYAAPEAVVRFRMRQQATMEMAFASDVYSLGLITFSLVNSRNGWSQ